MNTINEIHESDLYGLIYEMGAGLGISHGLMEVSGASKTIHAAHSLYSESSVAEHFSWGNVHNHGRFDRSVSWQACEEILAASEAETTNVNVNFSLVSSFQISNDPSMSTHGWIGLKYKRSIKYYHVSIPSNLSRRKAIREIAKTGISILAARNVAPIRNSYVDFILNRAGIPDVNYTFETLSLSDKNLATVVRLDGKGKVSFSRLETILRLESGVHFYRGSFNPWHEAHNFLLREVEDGGGVVYPTLTTDPFSKNRLNSHELRDRALTLLHKGVGPVILTTKPFFKEFYALCENKHANKDISFLMGDDTLQRIVECGDIDLFQKEKVSAVCGQRTGYKYPGKANVSYIENNPHYNISSTALRRKTNEKTP